MKKSTQTEWLLPAGYYKAKVLGVFPKTVGNSWIPSYFWNFEITSGKYEGRHARGLTPRRLFPRNWHESIERRLTEFLDGLLGRDVTWKVDQSFARGQLKVSRVIDHEELFKRFQGTECRIRIGRDRSQNGYYAVIEVAAQPDHE